MEFSGSFTSGHSRETLWNYFTDPAILEEVGPGVESMTLVTPSNIEAVLSVGVGSIKPTFDVDVTVTRTERPEILEMQVGGEASRNSFEAVALMTLTENGDGSTTCEWEATTDVSGLLASLGGRALRSVTEKLVTDFFEDLEEVVADGRDAEAKLEADSEVEASLEK
ncbi:MAG: CoxG family protein [Halolamina sp.]